MEVQKASASSKINSGYINKINYSYKYKDELLFKNAVVVKCDSGEFLRPGDSGALICYIDSKNNKQAFAYGVCEIVDSDSDVVFCENDQLRTEKESLFICLKLSTGLRKLELSPDTGCFKNCGSTQQGGWMN